MPELTTQDEILTDMTLKEAQEVHSISMQFVTDKAKAELGLTLMQFLMHQRNGWKKLNRYKSFEEYCEEAHNTPRRTVYDHIEQIKETLYIKQIPIGRFVHMCTNEIERQKISLVPTTITRDFAKLEPAKKTIVLEQFYGVSSANRLDTDPSSKKIGYRQLGQIIKAHLAPSKPPVSDPSAADRELTAKKAAELAEKECIRQQAEEAEYITEAEARNQKTAIGSLMDTTEEETGDYPETEEEARALVGGAPVEEDVPKITLHRAQTCQRDDTTNSLFVTFAGLSGCLETVQIHYAILPGDMQPR